MTRVLLAEDDTSISEPLSRALRREGYEVDVTADGPTTLDRALNEGVDLILLDIGLPDLDGLEGCRRGRGRRLPSPGADPPPPRRGGGHRGGPGRGRRRLRDQAVPAGRAPGSGPRS